MGKRQKAVILSYHQPPELTKLVDALVKHEYDIVLLITGRGPNYAMADGAYEKMGAQIANVFEAYDFPILAVKNITTARPFILAADADLALCMGFPYPITADLLSSRTKFVNFHPAPLPLLAGGSAFVWPIPRPDLFPLDQYTVTAHYMTPVVDQGPLILTPRIQLPAGIDKDNVTSTQIYTASLAAIGQAADEVVRLVREDYQGREADPLPVGYTENMARRLLDEERTITRDMTITHADRIWRARFGPQNPFFRNEHGLFKIVALSKVEADSPMALKARRQASGAARVGTRVIQAFDDGVLELDVRKL